MESEQELAVWRALADPTRRQLLTLLRQGPETTGTLCEAFEMSRYGVMKHLDVLEAAGLLLIKREGRHRFNHLNAIPLRRIHQRFVREFAAEDASRLLRLEALIQQPHPPGKAMTTNTNRSFHIVQEIRYQADVEKVWLALTSNIGQWWGFHIGPKDSQISLDGQVGGLFIERWGEGEGELYGTVTFLRKHTKMTLEGGMGLSGPGLSKFSFTLDATTSGTTLTLDHYCHGYRKEDTEASFAEGWETLLGTFLKRWLEEDQAVE